MSSTRNDTIVTKTVKITEQEPLPDGISTKIKTTTEKVESNGQAEFIEEITVTITERTYPDGRTVSEETTRVEKPSGGNMHQKNDEQQGTRSKNAEKEILEKKKPDAKKPEPSKAESPRKEADDEADEDGESTDFRQVLLRLHNEKRRLHGAGKLVLSDKLNSVAQEWANYIAGRRSLQHRPNNQYGENCFMAWNNNGVSEQEVVDSWYNEVENYNYNYPGFAYSTGHFTQVVWKASKEVGFGWATASDGGVYVVANYHPRGNMQGDFQRNVSPPLLLE